VVLSFGIMNMPAWSILYAGIYAGTQTAGAWHRVIVGKEKLSVDYWVDYASVVVLVMLFVSYWQPELSQLLGKGGIVLFLPAALHEALTFSCAFREARQQLVDGDSAGAMKLRVIIGLGVASLPMIIVSGLAVCDPWIT
jgi:hypothetical protein